MDESLTPGVEPLSEAEKHETRLTALRLVIDRGYADIEAGRVSTKDEVFARLRAKHRQRYEPV